MKKFSCPMTDLKATQRASIKIFLFTQKNNYLNFYIFNDLSRLNYLNAAPLKKL